MLKTERRVTLGKDSDMVTFESCRDESETMKSLILKSIRDPISAVPVVDERTF